MSRDYDGPTFYKVVEHEQPGTGYLANNSHCNLASGNCGENNTLNSEGLKEKTPVVV